jgi:WD40 repeat protein
MKTTVLIGHSGTVICISIFPDGTIVSASGDHTIVVWDEFVPNKVLRGHKDWVQSISCCDDNKTIASASNDESVRIWDRNQEQSLQVLKGHTSYVWSVLIRSDHTVFSGSDDTTIRMWLIENAVIADVVPAILQGHTDAVCALAVISDNDTLISGSNDKTVRIWSTLKLILLRTLIGHIGIVWWVAIFPDRRIISACEDQTLRIWEHDTGKCLAELRGHRSDVRSVCCVNDSIFVTGSNDTTVCVWNCHSGIITQTFTGHTKPIICVAVSNDGVLVSGSRDQTIRHWGMPFPPFGRYNLVYHASVWLASSM